VACEEQKLRKTRNKLLIDECHACLQLQGHKITTLSMLLARTVDP